MPARRRSAATRATETVEPGLRLHAEGERYSTLLRERERLLRGIRSKKLKLERTLQTSEAARHSVLERLRPFLKRHDATTAEIRALFDELLAPGRLGARAAKLVAQVRRTMAVLGFLGDLDEHEHEERQGPPDHDEQPEQPPFGDAEHAREHGQREVGSAEQRGQAKDQASLRAIFRRLVAASHPDRATNEADRERRTEALKLATQAYEQGDLARLLELEAAWQRGQSLPPAGSTEASCRELELVIRQLRAQASQLQRELRGAQASASLTPEAEPIAQALAEAEQDIEQLEAVRDFVRSFHNGQMSLAEFMAGPAPRHVEEDLEAILSEVFGTRPKAPPKRRPAKSKRSKPR